MKFSAVIVSAAMAVAVSAADTTTTTQAPPTKVSLSPQASCVNACPMDDNYSSCQAECVGVPHPNAQGTENTRKCVAACPQGNGTADQTAIYAACIQKCYKQYFLTSGVPLAPVTTGGSETGTGMVTMTTGGSSSGGSGSGSSGSSNGGSSSGSSTSSSSQFAPGVVIPSGSLAGLAGLMMGIFAL